MALKAGESGYRCSASTGQHSYRIKSDLRFQSPSFKTGPRTTQDLRGRTEIIPVEDPHTRIKPLPVVASGHGRYITFTPERVLVSVWEWPRWALLALWPAPIPPLFPPVLLVSLSIPPLCPSAPPATGVSWIPRVPSGPFGVPLDPPACPPVPLVSLGSYSSIVIVQCDPRPLRPLSWCLAARCPLAL
jgi:hypothetical protein